MKKYREYIYDAMNPQKELNEFIEKYMDDKLEHHYISGQRAQDTLVKWLNAENFKEEILNYKESDQFMIEII